VPQSSREGIDVYSGVVRPEWIDMNNHMNVAYYSLAFDEAVDAVWLKFGISETHIRETHSSTFAVESHLTYQGEMNLGERFDITVQVLAFDEKRIHHFQRMYHAEKHTLAATCEWMSLHIDLSSRRVANWPYGIRERIADFAKRQGQWSMPDEAGRTINIKKPQFFADGYKQ